MAVFGAQLRAVQREYQAHQPLLLLQEKPHPKPSRSSKAPQDINRGTLQCRYRQLTSHCVGSAAALVKTLYSSLNVTPVEGIWALFPPLPMIHVRRRWKHMIKNL